MENTEELLQRMEKQLFDLEERDRRRHTANIIIWVCVLAALILLAVLLLPKISSFIEGYNNSLVILDRVADSLSEVDTEKLSETLKAVSEIDAEKIRSIADAINEVSEMLEPIKNLFT